MFDFAAKTTYVEQRICIFRVLISTIAMKWRGWCGGDVLLIRLFYHASQYESVRKLRQNHHLNTLH